MPHNKVLLSGSRHLVALIEARRRAKAGDVVHTADSVDFDYTPYSRYVTAYHRLPSVRFDEQGYIEALCKVLNDHEIDELVALGEEVFYIARNRATLQRMRPGLKLNVEGIGTLDTLHNKWKFSTLAKRLSLPMPPTQKVLSDKEVDKWRQDNSKACVIKAEYSRFGHTVTILQADEELQPNRIDWDIPQVIQLFIQGTAFSSFSEKKGSGIICYENPLELSGVGAMASARRITTPKRVRAIETSIRTKLKYTGQLGLDFIRSDEGSIALLEANPRATIGHILLHQDRIQSRIVLLHQLLSGMIPRRQLVKYWSVVLTYPDTVWDWGNLMPVFMSQVRSKGLGTYLRFRKRHPGVTFQSYSTYDMEYNGATLPKSLASAPLKQEDAALTSLLSQLALGRAIQLTQARNPSPISSFSREGSQLGVIRDGRGVISYMAACSNGMFYINGVKRSLGYLSAVRKAPSYIGGVDWRTSFFTFFNAPAYFFSILDKNTTAQRSFSRHSPSRPAPQRIGSYELFIVNAKRVAAPSKTTARFVPAHKLEWAALRSFLNSEGRQKQLFPLVTDRLLKRLGVTPSNSYALMKGGVVVGFASLVDQRDWKQFIITRYPGIIRLLRAPWNAFARRFGYISVPKINTPISCPTVTLAVVRGDDPTLYHELMYGLSLRAQSLSDIFMTALTVDSLHRELLHTKYHFRIKNTLYVQEIETPVSLDTRPLYVDALMLY